MVWHQCSLKAGAVSLVVFEPFYTMEALNNIVVLHLLHAAAVENALPPPPRRYLPRVARIRDDPFTLPDREFKIFSTATILKVPVSCLPSLVSLLLPLVFSLLSPLYNFLSLYSCLLYHVSCLLSPFSGLLSHVSCLTSPVSCILSHVSCLMFPVCCRIVLL